MTLIQEAYEKMTLLPESNIRMIIALLDEMLKQSDSVPVEKDTLTKKQAAFQRMLTMQAENPFPKDFDWEKSREEAMREKYGHFM